MLDRKTMKILYITTIGDTMDFFTSFIRSLMDQGHVVDIATNENGGETPVSACYREWGCKVYPIDTSRSPISMGNIRAIRQIRCLVEKNRYDLVHCHTPLASVAARQACRGLRKSMGLQVFYTAHGFHFYDGAPLKNWLIYYPIEKHFSRYTDVLITINQEDYKRASEQFHAKKTVYVPGVGVDVEKFAPLKSGRERIRAELAIPEDRIMILSVGELNENKNHEAVIRAVAGMDLTYVVVGKGKLGEKLETAATECGVDLRLMGFRSDVADFYTAADVYVLPSIREGLNVSLMEAMASGCSCCCGRIRGNTDLIVDSKCMFEPRNTDEIRNAIEYATGNRDQLGSQNIQRIKRFDTTAVTKSTAEIYGVSL